VYLSASNIPQMLVFAVTAVTGVNDAVTAPEPQVTDLTAPNSAPAESTPETRSITLPLHVDDGVKVTVTPLTVVPLLVTAVHNFPTVSLAGEVTRYTSAHSLPSEELLVEGDADADTLADAVGRPEALLPAEGMALAEALGVADGCEVAAEATATVRPIAVSREPATITPLPSVRLRMENFPS
jgi:hypothetical protein